MIKKIIILIVFSIACHSIIEAFDWRSEYFSKKEQFRIEVENSPSGSIKISHDSGQSWQELGVVRKPNFGCVHQIQNYEFTASDWAPDGSVAATAVNAIHLKVGQRKNFHAVIFSILPSELFEHVPTRSYRDESATIFTSIPAGSGIFGAPYAPSVGDEIYLKHQDNGRIEPWPEKYAPKIGDRIVIVSHQKKRRFKWIEIENKWDGYVTLVGKGYKKVLARVFRPFGGTGRFGGSVFQKVGQIRANHPGVICISSSPKGVLGGVQIVPSLHANSPSLHYLYGSTAYMVIGRLNDQTSLLEGSWPLFLGMIKPGYGVKAKINGHWQNFPEVSGKKASGLSQVKAIRILL